MGKKNVYIYIYIYREREREREKKKCTLISNIEAASKIVRKPNVLTSWKPLSITREVVGTCISIHFILQTQL